MILRKGDYTTSSTKKLLTQINCSVHKNITWLILITALLVYLHSSCAKMSLYVTLWRNVFQFGSNKKLIVVKNKGAKNKCDLIFLTYVLSFFSQTSPVLGSISYSQNADIFYWRKKANKNCFGIKNGTFLATNIWQHVANLSFFPRHLDKTFIPNSLGSTKLWL